MRKLVLGALFVLGATCALQPSTPSQESAPAGSSQPACMSLGRTYTRTTLYFGLSRPAGTISERRWQAFLRDEVTPRFPDGLTVWEASGQWKRPDGRIARERAKVLLVVHEQSPTMDAAVKSIVQAYKDGFQQQSVLWETAQVCVAF